MQANHGPREGGKVIMAGRAERKAAKRRQWSGMTSSEEMQCSQVKEDFFLCEQGCSVGHTLASHVRGQRKFHL
jgi:hypothetical protein